MGDKTGPKFGPYQLDDDEVASLSRRRLILGMGMVSGALVLGGAKTAQAADCPTPDVAATQDERWQNSRFMVNIKRGVNASTSGNDVGGF